jgi:SpoVK/Ycf46/Vps4 family AAA+-type ATPase
LASVAVSGDGDRGTGIVRRLARKYRTLDPLIAEQFIALLRTSPMRKAETAAPVDVESRLPLVREESTPALDNEPIWDDLTSEAMRQLANEHRRADELLAAGLTATRTALFIGPPGVGKTLSARWIARELGKPLALLDLSSVMSSYLGKTGTNLRHVLDYAKSRDCILFLDELDAIAKRRDDVGEIGELKRLVTVLLQEIDAWPSGGLLIAATNHSNLLDPAVWRRFEMVVDFPRPQERQARAALVGFLSGEEGLGPVIDVLAMAYAGTSYSDIERSTARARRASTLQRTPLEETLASDARMRFAELSPQTRRDLAVRLLASTPMSQRRVADLTGVSRDTLRKHATVSRKDGTPS